VFTFPRTKLLQRCKLFQNQILNASGSGFEEKKMEIEEPTREWERGKQCIPGLMSRFFLIIIGEEGNRKRE